MVFLNSLMIKIWVAIHTNVSDFADTSKQKEMLFFFSVPVVFACLILWISNKQGVNIGQSFHCLFQVFNKLWCVAYRVLLFIHRGIRNLLLSVWPVNKWCFLKRIHCRFWHHYFFPDKMQADQSVAASSFTSKVALYVFEFENDLLVQLGAHHSPYNLWQNLQFDKLDRTAQKSQRFL